VGTAVEDVMVEVRFTVVMADEASRFQAMIRQ
jgi:hypothetical protein